MFEVRQLPSLVVIWKERDWPSRKPLLCQFCPQFRDIGCQSVFVPLMETEITSPAPATLVMSTRLKNEWPFIVNLIPPVFMHGTLDEKNEYMEYKIIRTMNEWNMGVDYFDVS